MNPVVAGRRRVTAIPALGNPHCSHAKAKDTHPGILGQLRHLKYGCICCQRKPRLFSSPLEEPPNCMVQPAVLTGAMPPI